jgi:hypothetical protein
MLLEFKWDIAYDDIGIALVVDYNWNYQRFVLMAHFLFWGLDFRIYFV